MQIMPLLAFSMIQSSVTFSALKHSLSVALSQCDSSYRGVFSALFTCLPHPQSPESQLFVTRCGTLSQEVHIFLCVLFH